MTPTVGMIRAGLIAALLTFLWAGPARATEYISRDEWPAIQRGIQVTQYARIAGVVNALDRAEGADIVILHPGGAAGHEWALEIRDWLVALAVPSRMITLRPGSGVPGAIGLQVEEQGYRERRW